MSGSCARQFEEQSRVRVGVLNLMPDAESYETYLVQAFDGTTLPVDLTWLRLRGRTYSRNNPAHIEANYSLYEHAISNGALDGIVVTGAPFEHLPYQRITILPELREILIDATARGTAILGLCWGAFAAGHLLLGIGKREFSKKLFGVFETDTVNSRHPFSNGFDDRFWSAHSRWAGLCEGDVENAAARGCVNVLARSETAGHVILATPNCGLLLHTGHPEYPSTRLVEEYDRDRARGFSSIAPPQNLDLRRPLNLWRSHCRILFGSWVQAAYIRKPNLTYSEESPT